MATIEIRNVEKAFGNVQVLQGIDLAIPDGEFLVLVGPSGCGKSTLLRIIAGLEHVTNGAIAINRSATGATSRPNQLGSSLPVIQTAMPTRKAASSRPPATRSAHASSTPASTSVSNSAKPSAKRISSMAVGVNEVDR